MRDSRLARPTEGESVIAYAVQLREKSKDCEFEEQTEDRILEHFIQTIKDNELVKRHIQKKWVLDRFLEKASQRKDIDQQAKDMKEYFGISKVEHQSKDLPVGWKKKIEDTTVTSHKTRTQIRESEKQELWLLWKNRNISPVPKLPSIRKTVFKVWQVQSLCIMLQSRSSTSRWI